MEHGQIRSLIDRYSRTSFLVNKRAESIMKDQVCDVLTNDQFYILRYIQDKGSCMPSDLADAFCVKKGAITAIISRLEDKDLVTRTRANEDRRVIYIKMTEQGERLYRETEAKLQKLVEQLICQFDDEEITAFLFTYERLAESLLVMKRTGGEHLV